MAEIKKGILGGFSGKVGTVIGVNWRGKDIIRSLPKASKKAPTEEQLIQRVKFRKTIVFYNHCVLSKTGILGIKQVNNLVLTMRRLIP